MQPSMNQQFVCTEPLIYNEQLSPSPLPTARPLIPSPAVPLKLARSTTTSCRASPAAALAAARASPLQTASLLPPCEQMPPVSFHSHRQPSPATNLPPIHPAAPATNCPSSPAPLSVQSTIRICVHGQSNPSKTTCSLPLPESKPNDQPHN